MLQDMIKIDECDMEKFDTLLDSSEKTMAIPGDRWWPKTATQEKQKKNPVQCMGENVTSAQMLEASLLEVGTLFHLERDAWPNGQMTKASNN